MNVERERVDVHVRERSLLSGSSIYGVILLLARFNQSRLRQSGLLWEVTLTLIIAGVLTRAEVEDGIALERDGK